MSASRWHRCAVGEECAEPGQGQQVACDGARRSRPVLSRSRAQRLASVRSQGWVIRSNRRWCGRAVSCRGSGSGRAAVQPPDIAGILDVPSGAVAQGLDCVPGGDQERDSPPYLPPWAAGRQRPGHCSADRSSSEVTSALVCVTGRDRDCGRRDACGAGRGRHWTAYWNSSLSCGASPRKSMRALPRRWQSAANWSTSGLPGAAPPRCVGPAEQRPRVLDPQLAERQPTSGVLAVTDGAAGPPRRRDPAGRSVPRCPMPRAQSLPAAP